MASRIGVNEANASETGVFKPVRQGQQNRRGRGRNRKGQNPLSRSFESNGPDVKIRGTPAHIAEKYISLARDAQASGDPVLAENYLQHAEHYSRIIMAYREQFQQPGESPNGAQRVRGHEPEAGDDFGVDEGEELLEEAVRQPPQGQPQVRQAGSFDFPRHDRPFRREQARPREQEGRPSEGRGETNADAADPRRRERFQHMRNQPEFLRRPVRRVRDEEEQPPVPPRGSDEPQRD
jgi:hypothetical protein